MKIAFINPERGVIIIGAHDNREARKAIMIAQGHSVTTLTFEQANEINLPIVEDKLNVIDEKHLRLNQSQKKKLNDFTHSSKYHK